MNSFRIYFLVTIFKLLMSMAGSGQTLRVGFLLRDITDLKFIETREALEFAKGSIDVRIITGEQIISPENLNGMDLLWFHNNDSVFNGLGEPAIKAIQNYVDQGGRLLLTLEGFRLINDLGLEPVRIETRNKQAVDEGYGRQLGLHAFKEHPVFDGMNGGAYILKPVHDTTVRIHGFFDDNVPKNGEVVAVDWDYIFLREGSKLMVQYRAGKGKVLAVGGYTVFSCQNTNRAHLELFLRNCFRYLVSGDSVQANYWKYDSQQVVSEIPLIGEKYSPQVNPWQVRNSDLVLKKDTAGKDFWEVAGERLVIMGEENAGIKEIWVHPFMALRDYSVGLRLPHIDTICWLHFKASSIEVRPESFHRKYSFKEGELTETIIASPVEPAGVIHYSWSGLSPADLLIKFQNNFRLMWPYSEEVTKKIACGFDTGLNAIIFNGGSDEYTCIIGSDKKVEKAIAGHYGDFVINFDRNGERSDKFRLTGISTEEFVAGGLISFPLKNEEELSVIVAAASKIGTMPSTVEASKSYIKAAKNPGAVYNQAFEHYRDLLEKNSLLITSPDPVFNGGYRWALTGTDRFFVHTPGLGKSLVAGYSTTGTGWDGGHRIDGRPGYAWYFGRDGEWSGFALLDYGDFEKVKSILEMYIKFQDLNGKIYHEVSTSGIVHYDAADATPLFIILAGKYLAHSGDEKFITQNWHQIKKAIGFCFSTDTDNDHLIENTNVGHGWEEGGSLFGSHSSLYLSSCWAEALYYAGIMAETSGNMEESKFYTTESERVIGILNSDFWNTEKQYYYQGKFSDGSYHKGQSIMPAIPMYFGQTDPDKAAKILPVFAGCNFSTDWGCRIMGDNNSDYNPRSYHSGSVWPLFTGWAALAEYKYGNCAQGFAHIMNNLQIYRHWGLGYIEEVLNGDTYSAQGVCRHQCWSETMVLQPAIEGMLGFEPDALNSSLTLAPSLPADWDSIGVKNIRVGDHTIGFAIKRQGNTISYNFEHVGASAIRLVFNPHFAEGSEIKGIHVAGNFEEKNLNPSEIPVIYLNDKLIITYWIENGIAVLPQVYQPEPGDPSNGMRIIETHLQKNQFKVTVEGLQGTTDKFRFYLPDQSVASIENAQIIDKSGKIYTLKVNFEAGQTKYLRKQVTIILN